jgi:hypothetical protein
MVEGSCLCGTVRWQMEGPYDAMRNCHCSMCRKAHASAFATFISVKKSQFNWLSGEDNIVDYRSSPKFTRSFCKSCGSNLPMSKLSETNNIVPAGCLNDDPGIKPQERIFVASKAPWYEIADDIPQFETYPDYIPRGVIEQPARSKRDDGKLQGSCLCGAAIYLITPPFNAIYQCHCNRCRKARAAAFTINGFVEAENFEYVQGEDFIDRFNLPEADRFAQSFCSVCGSGMPHVGVTDRPVPIPFGSLDDDPGGGPQAHIFTANMAPWDSIDDDLQQYPGWLE